MLYLTFSLNIFISHKVQANGLGITKVRYNLLETYIIYSDTKCTTIIIHSHIHSLICSKADNHAVKTYAKHKFPGQYAALVTHWSFK